MTDTSQTREQMLTGKLADAHFEYTRHSHNATALAAQAASPCGGDHQCEEDHDDADCDCDLTCSCASAEQCRQDAAIQAALAQAAALAMNTFALMLAHKL